MSAEGETGSVHNRLHKMWLPLFHMEIIGKGLAGIAKTSTCSALAEVQTPVDEQKKKAVRKVRQEVQSLGP